MSYKPIACHLYDYIEIACMHHYLLEIRLIDGTTLKGKAQDTVISDKKEFFVVEISGEIKNIQLDKVKDFTALDDSAVFKTIALT